ncbi:hypothetical protein KKF61_07580 [Patescibacteria group bacterium]|nr:hypothetical protein [Patescibacteria group bacterium]
MANFKDTILQRKDNIYRNHSVRSKLHPQWHDALSFFEGQQWRKQKFESGRWRFKDMTTENVYRKMTINRIEKIITTFVAHFMKELPSFRGSPNSNTPDDLAAAELSTNILTSEYAPNLEGVLEEYFYWKYITGTGIRGLFWDPTASAQMRLPQYDMAGQETGHLLSTIPEIGKLYQKAINPFNFFPVGAGKVEDCTEILYVESVPISEIEGRFNFKPTAETVDTAASSGRFKRDYEEFEFETFEDRAKVFQYWRKVSKEFKNGLYSVMIGDKILEYKDNRYVKYSHPYPFFKSCSVPIPGRFFGKSPVELMRKPQIAYNYVFSIILQTLEKMGKTHWWAVKGGAGIEEDPKDRKIGQISYYQPDPGGRGGPPSPAPIPPIPHYFFQIIDYLDKSFEDISGFHEVKSARLPTGANNPSGVMVNLLLEQDETRLAPAIKDYLYSLRKEGKLYLEMVQDLYEERRVLKIVGQEKEPLIQDFKGADLKGNTDVIVELAPIMSDSRAAWEQTLREGVQMGLVDPLTYLQKMKLENPRQLENILSEQRLAIRENTEMRHGTERPVLPFHKDEIHIPIHEELMKTRSFEALPGQSQELVGKHYQEHMQQQAQKFMQQMKAQQQQAAASQPPQPVGGQAGRGNIQGG